MNAPKESAPLADDALKTNGLRAEYHDCTHRTTRLERMPANHIHYAREFCMSCGRFVRWAPRPETVRRRKLLGFTLARLAMCSGLSTWERNFVRDIAHRRKISPRQEALVDRLTKEYL